MKKSSRKIQSVYRNQNALVSAVFERTGDARKVLCVALDLLGIAKTLLFRRARLTGETGGSNPAYHHLREISRCRRGLVRQQTAAQTILFDGKRFVPP